MPATSPSGIRHGSRLPAARARIAVLVILLLAGAGSARAQDTTAARPTGLPEPERFQWTFNLDAGIGAFGFNNSLYTDVRPDPSGDLSDNWFESFVKPAISGTMTTGKSQVFGKLSFAGERTFSAPPPVVGEEASSFQVEDLYLGWRSGTMLDMGENALEFIVGRSQYRIGHGFLIWDGGGEGGSRGGFWSNARKAWEFAGIAAFRPGRHSFEAFYLDRDEVPESNTHSSLWGANYDLKLGEATTIGASYLKLEADPDEAPARDGMNVFNVRAFTAPFQSIPGLAFEAEYAREDNDDLLSSTAWTVQAGYEFGSIGWKPRISYRYAFFEGDDPDTPESEAFDPLFLGFYDWGTWWQGEIAGEYFLANSNNISHQVRLHLTPSESVSGGLIGWSFELDQPASFAPGVTATDVALELDAYLDWKLNSNFTLSLLAAYADPQEAAEQGFGRTSNFTYGMAYLTYAY